jgi:replicative DNA helicase
MVDLEDLKLPPHHIEAEKGILSCVLLENEVMYTTESVQLKPEDFYLKEHQYIFEALTNLWASRKTIDVITLSDMLNQ